MRSLSNHPDHLYKKIVKMQDINPLYNNLLIFICFDSASLIEATIYLIFFTYKPLFKSTIYSELIFNNKYKWQAEIILVWLFIPLINKQIIAFHYKNHRCLIINHFLSFF